ncbi:MAG: hypothetical protein K0Q90_3977 [Paenibacillaceae bacterium]|nr:hypothetical protein [Paenibacillaceae bacterium]
MLYNILQIFAAILGLAVTGGAVYTVWRMFQVKAKTGAPGKLERQLLLRWTVFDYAILVLVLVGLVFLLSDVIGVIKDRDQYPYYHYGYLLSGFIFSAVGLVFMLVRLTMVLRLANPDSAPVDQGNKPDQAYPAE